MSHGNNGSRTTRERGWVKQDTKKRKNYDKSEERKHWVKGEDSKGKYVQEPTHKRRKYYVELNDEMETPQD